MNITLGLARVSGIICLLIGLSVMNKKYMAAIVSEIENSKALLWTLGFMAAVLGLVSLSIYNAWSGDWKVLLTILGWVSLLKGIAIMAFPAASWHSLHRKYKSDIFVYSGGLALILGIILVYFGFWG